MNKVTLLQSFMDASPYIKQFEMKVTEADKDAGTLTITMPFSDVCRRVKGNNQFHGGAIASLIDTTGTFALMLVQGKPISTINFRSDYLRAAKDTNLTAVALVRKVGRTVCLADIEVTNDEGELVAVGRGTFTA